MSDKLEVISASNLPDDRKPDVTQTGNENVAIANYGTVQMQVNQQFCGMPQLGGQFYVPPRINREYYNIFVIGTEEYDKPYFKVPRDRALSECMSKGTKEKFSGMTKEDKQQIIMMPSLFMAENHQYGNADDGQKVI